MTDLENHPFEISAVMDSQSDTKVTMSDGFKLTWDMVKGSENIWVMSRNGSWAEGSALEIVRTEDEGATAVFGFSKTGSPFESGFNNALEFNAVYPYKYTDYMPSLKMNGSAVYNAFLCDISSSQVIKGDDNMDKTNLYMLASGSRADVSAVTPELKFKNAVSLLSFTVTNDDVRKMVVSVNCSLANQSDANFTDHTSIRDMIAGPAYVYYDCQGSASNEHFGAMTGKYSQVSSYVFNQITVTREGGKAFEKGKTYYIPVWPGTKTDFRATAYDSSDNVVTTKSTASFTCNRSQVHSMKAF